MGLKYLLQPLAANPLCSRAFQKHDNIVYLPGLPFNFERPMAQQLVTNRGAFRTYVCGEGTGKTHVIGDVLSRETSMQPWTTHTRPA